MQFQKRKLDAITVFDLKYANGHKMDMRKNKH